MNALGKMFESLKNGFSSVKPELVFIIFTAVVVASFVAALILSGRRAKGYIAAFKRAVEYLKSDGSVRLEKNNARFFHKEYVSFFPPSMKSRVEAFMSEFGGRPSFSITESESLKPPSNYLQKKSCLALFDLFLFTFFAFAAVFTFGDGAVFGVAALLPLTFGVLLRYILRLRSDALDAELSLEFYSLMEAMDDAVGFKEEISEEKVTFSKVSALIDEIMAEEKEAQRFYFYNKTDDIQKELRAERLDGIVQNVDMVCGKNISLATLRRIFTMVADAKSIYKTPEESEILNGCLTKLKNAMAKAERDI